MIEEFQGGSQSIFTNRVNPDESYLYHYTSASTLARILESRALMMGPYSATNDPRETSGWGGSIELTHDEALDQPEEIGRLWSLVRDAREGVKLACFTLDRETDQPTFRLPFHRGWARARMWHQYADRHSGVCLIFDRERWGESLQLLSEENSFDIHEGAITYEDVKLGHYQRILTYSSDELRAGQVKDAIARIVRDHRDDLFFKKNRDWESENEYRYLAIGEAEKEFVPIATSLVGIVLGQDFPDTEVAVLADRLRRNGLEQVKCARLSWSDGGPSIMVDHDSQGRGVLALLPTDLSSVHRGD
ncbi:DUF2971 domain-containing protein [Psychromicrobium xiongbiense]|uniref:DUF2971 domain-containing protein n=1 Tax=Psychromicrobium xiongbiense TaxID=3051184 RepID=UPI002556F69F|nr:DUF2971 domain-containing protein [Psychromicrobium sp. YIM S02556]